MNWLGDLAPHWFWLSAGALLAAAEMLAPGFFLIWLGVAAVVTGMIALALPIGFPAQLVVFAGLAIVSVQVSRKWFRMDTTESEDPLLNDRAARLVGEVVQVVEAIEAGSGRVKVGDGVWTATGPDLPEGSRARIIAVKGTRLEIEPV
jgi:membrane protein implicated in regulation of membrane protease activity